MDWDPGAPRRDASEYGQVESRDTFLRRSECLSGPGCGRATASSKEDEGCLENPAPGLEVKAHFLAFIVSGLGHPPGPFYTLTPKYVTRSIPAPSRQLFRERTLKRDVSVYPSNTNTLWLLVKSFDFPFL